MLAVVMSRALGPNTKGRDKFTSTDAWEPHGGMGREDGPVPRHLLAACEIQMPAADTGVEGDGG